jgi:hypothetical protein
MAAAAAAQDRSDQKERSKTNHAGNAGSKSSGAGGGGGGGYGGGYGGGARRLRKSSRSSVGRYRRTSLNGRDIVKQTITDSTPGASSAMCGATVVDFGSALHLLGGLRYKVSRIAGLVWSNARTHANAKLRRILISLILKPNRGRNRGRGRGRDRGRCLQGHAPGHGPGGGQ